MAFPAPRCASVYLRVWHSTNLNITSYYVRQEVLRSVVFVVWFVYSLTSCQWPLFWLAGGRRQAYGRAINFAVALQDPGRGLCHTIQTPFLVIIRPPIRSNGRSYKMLVMFSFLFNA